MYKRRSQQKYDVLMFHFDLVIKQLFSRKYIMAVEVRQCMLVEPVRCWQLLIDNIGGVVLS